MTAHLEPDNSLLARVEECCLFVIAWLAQSRPRPRGWRCIAYGSRADLQLMQKRPFLRIKKLCWNCVATEFATKAVGVGREVADWRVGCSNMAVWKKRGS